MPALAQLEKCGGWETLERVFGHRWEISGCGSGPTSVRCLWNRKEPSRNARGWKKLLKAFTRPCLPSARRLHP